MSTRAASAGAYTALGGVERAHGIPRRGSGEVTFRHTLASVGYTVRVLFMVLPYVMTFFALLVSGDLTSDWSHVLFHPMGQFILVYALGHIVANVCFNFRMGTGLVRSVNALGAVLCGRFLRCGSDCSRAVTWRWMRCGRSQSCSLSLWRAWRITCTRYGGMGRPLQTLAQCQ